MKQLIKLIVIGFISGIILALFLKGIKLLNNTHAYDLLFNFDYIPVINHWEPDYLWGTIFHYSTCVFSVVALYYILRLFHLERKTFLYFLAYTGGGAVLFFLTALSDQPPAATNMAAWIYWTVGHATFSVAVGVLIKKWT
ncbi:hypothetical protein ACLIBG_10005 [Virgibacillus sp. W0181]|uniref:hypothetical protein n=1 Tax=Virgibacillus sp. W0181 TaxID=3391581 RepID=UPI003F4823E4